MLSQFSLKILTCCVTQRSCDKFSAVCQSIELQHREAVESNLCLQSDVRFRNTPPLISAFCKILSIRDHVCLAITRIFVKENDATCLTVCCSVQ